MKMNNHQNLPKIYLKRDQLLRLVEMAFDYLMDFMPWEMNYHESLRH